MSDLYWLGTVVRNGDRLVYGTDMTQPLQSYVGMQLYAKTYVNNAYTYVDVSRMLTLIPKVDMTQTLGEFLSSLNTLTVLNYLDPTCLLYSSYAAHELSGDTLRVRLIRTPQL